MPDDREQYFRVKIHWGWEARAAGLVHGRISEALLALRTVFWGAFVYFTPPSMATPAYDGILAIASEKQVSAAAMVVGLVYLLALRVNGGQRAATSTVRTLAAGAITALWVALLIGFLTTVPYSTAVPAYLFFIVAQAAYDFVKAATDAMRVARGVKETRAWLG